MSSSPPHDSSFCGLHRSSSFKNAPNASESTPPVRVLRPKATTVSSSSKKGKRHGLGREDAKADSLFGKPRNINSKEDKSKLNKTKSTEPQELPSNNNNPRRPSADFQWARDDQLSVVLELLEDESRNTPLWEKLDPFRQHPIHPALQKPSTSTILEHPQPTPLPTPIPTPIETPPRTPRYNKIGAKERAYRIPQYINSRPSTQRSEFNFVEDSTPVERMSRPNSTRDPPESPRPIPHPPRDLNTIARIDGTLVFEHFTTTDAWVLGSALRDRLLPISTPVVISISLSNSNQVLFHCCTHSGAMPDSDNWVRRKRKTVLRWGVSTWYMWCKFDGDENAFRAAYGLGEGGGEYAIHGGGVPIRVTGVEGVVAVVVVSGLRQDEDHGVIVEVIRDLYY